MKIEELYKLYCQHFLVDTDTRKIRKNTLFFALKGDNFNGNKFAEEALKKGALFSVVDEVEFQTSKNIILVDNVLKTLQELANYHRRQLSVPVIALTGSNGKTTTKELINTVLSKQYKTTATIGNLNNHIGVPLTLLSMNNNTEIGIVEMGANHPKEIEFLSTIVEPDFGYITNFGKAHLEGFGSLEGVIESKSELYNFLNKSNKTVFVNSKDPIQLKKTNKMIRILFDESIQFLEVNPFVKLSFQNINVQSNLIGAYNFTNIAAAITIGEYFNVSSENIKNAIESYVPKNNRSQIIEKFSNKIILDAYNANPTSIKAALENFNILDAAKKTVILGDMFELGGNSIEEHQNIVDLATSYSFDSVFLIGENFSKTKTNNHQFKSFEDLKKYLSNNTIDSSVILIKGSRGMALERIVDCIS